MLDREELFSVANRKWFVHTKNLTCQRTRTFLFKKQPVPRCQIPAKYHQAMVQEKDRNVIITGHADFSDYQSTQTTWDSYSNTQDNHWTTHMRAEGQVQQLVQVAIQQHQTMAISNGSFMNQAEAAAWLIKGNSSEHHIKAQDGLQAKSRIRAHTIASFSSCGE